MTRRRGRYSAEQVAKTDDYGVPEGATVHLPRDMGGCTRRGKRGEVRYEIPMTEVGRQRAETVNCDECLAPLLSPDYVLPPSLTFVERLDGRLVDFGVKSNIVYGDRFAKAVRKDND